MHLAESCEPPVGSSHPALGRPATLPPAILALAVVAMSHVGLGCGGGEDEEAPTQPVVAADATAGSVATDVAAVAAADASRPLLSSGDAGQSMLPGSTSGPVSASDGGSASDATPSGHGHDAGPDMNAALQHCLVQPTADARDGMLTGEPHEITAGGTKDLLVPELVEKWMDENEFAQAHDGWHLVRKWDQGCRRSNAPAQGCASAQRLVAQGLQRAPIQQGAPGDGLAFMVMHRHMIRTLKATFPKHAALFDGFKKVPRTKADPENPTPWRNLSWSADNIKGFDTLENIEQNLAKFPTEDDLGNYIQNTYRWTAQQPLSPVNVAGDGLHGALHAQWSVNGSPANLINQAVDVKNHSFWKLHGWIDNVWERYRVAKGMREDDPAYQKALLEQCMEMHALMPRNRGTTHTPTGQGDAGTAAPETGTFAQTVRPSLDKTCGGCHSAIGPSAGLTLGGMGISSAEVREGLVGVKATNGQYNLIEPGAPDKSWVYLKASGDVATVTCSGACDRDKMPPSGAGLSAAELMTLRQWILDGATDK